MDLFSLVARLTLDKSQYEQGLNDAASDASSFGSKLKSGLGTAAKVGSAAMLAVGTAAVAGTKAIMKNAGEVAAYGDQIDKASQKLGISAKAYQEWDAVLQHSGTSIDSMGIGMKTLASQAAKGSDAFTALGISQEKAASMSREDLFAETITALQNVQNENQRAQLAQELFGRSAMELGPLLNTSAEETQAMRDRVNELGGVMNDEAVKAAAKYQDSLQDMQTAMTGMKNNLMGQFLPSITTVMDGITDLFSGGGTEKISEGINQFVDKIAEVAPRILNVGADIVMKLADAVVKNLPKLIEAATQTVLTLVDGLVKELPTIVQAGLEMILALAQGIAESLPELIPTIVDVVLEIVDILTQPDTLSNLLDAALQIIVALAEGITKATPRLIEKIPQIVINIVGAIIQSLPKIIEAGMQLVGAWAKGVINNARAVLNAVGQIGRDIVDFFINLGNSAWEWGKDMMLNLWEGIKAFISKPIDAVKGLAGKIKSFLGFSEPEEGPLSNFHTYAPDMMKLFAEGIEQNKGMIADAIDGAFSFGPSITGNMAGQGETYKVSRGGENGGRNIVIPIMIDGREFARAEVPYIEAEQNRVGIRLSGGYA